MHVRHSSCDAGGWEQEQLDVPVHVPASPNDCGLSVGAAWIHGLPPVLLPPSLPPASAFFAAFNLNPS